MSFKTVVRFIQYLSLLLVLRSYGNNNSIIIIHNNNNSRQFTSLQLAFDEGVDRDYKTLNGAKLSTVQSTYNLVLLNCDVWSCATERSRGLILTAFKRS